MVHVAHLKIRAINQASETEELPGATIFFQPEKRHINLQLNVPISSYSMLLEL